MRRRVPVLLVLAVLAVGATAVAQDGGGPPASEPDVRAREVFRMPAVCETDDRVTVRVNPSGALLASVRIHVAGLEVLRMTGVDNPASATVRIRPGRHTRVTATGDTIGGQALYRTRIYGSCQQSPDRPPVIGGGED